MNPKIFREYDIRGVVDQDFSLDDVEDIGKSFATYVQERAGPQIIVSYDGRLTSPKIEKALITGLTSTGAKIVRIGLGPTPQLYFAAHHFQADGAIMITGSHNPAEFNGFKLVVKGASLFGAAIQDLLKRIDSQDFKLGNGFVINEDIQHIYIKHLLNEFSTHYPRKDLKIAWDPANGATCDILSTLIPSLPGKHYIINDQVDGSFPNHHPDPTVPQNLQQLQELVQNNQCDLGISFDGDGDRLGVVDAHGRIILGDQLLALFAEEVLARHPGATVIADVKSSQHLFHEISRLGGIPLMWRTGHSLIKAKMKEVNCLLAGEMSGHMIFADRYFGFDDGLYAALRLIGILMQKQETLSDCLDKWPPVYNTPELIIPCVDFDKFEVTDQIKKNLQQESIIFNDIDGIRVTQPDGWWLLRPSNTQEALVARAESTTQPGLDRFLTIIEVNLVRCGININLIELTHV